MFEVKLLPDAEAAFRKLDRAVQTRIGQKIDWLSKNAAVNGTPSAHFTA